MNRKKQILEILKERGEITVKSLSKIFNVSEMTIYRDVRQLEKEGEIKRKHGSIVLNLEGNEDGKVVKRCPICEKPITRSHPYKLTVENTKTIEACCDHCGLLLHKKYEDQEVSALTYDFITENPVSVLEAYFVVGSDAKPCCSPSVIPFSDRSMAEKFVKGFGGKLLNFVEAYNEIINRSSLNIQSCCAPEQNVSFNLGKLKKD